MELRSIVHLNPFYGNRHRTVSGLQILIYQKGCTQWKTNRHLQGRGYDFGLNRCVVSSVWEAIAYIWRQ